MDASKWKLYESALIKSIRRCMVDDAVYWGMLLFDLGKADVVWRRLFIHLSEDIGVANETLPANIEALYNNFERLSKPGTTSFESPGANKLPLVHAIMLMANSEKSRAVDNAATYYTLVKEDREIPDYCYDYHSPLGKRMGRDFKHFFFSAGKIINESKFVDIWSRKVWNLLKSKQDFEM